MIEQSVKQYSILPCARVLQNIEGKIIQLVETDDIEEQFVKEQKRDRLPIVRVPNILRDEYEAVYLKDYLCVKIP